MIASSCAIASRRILDLAIAIWADESGATTLEYCAAGGVLSGLTFWAFEVLKEAQSAALDRVLSQVS